MTTQSLHDLPPVQQRPLAIMWQAEDNEIWWATSNSIEVHFFSMLQLEQNEASWEEAYDFFTMLRNNRARIGPNTQRNVDDWIRQLEVWLSIHSSDETRDEDPDNEF